MNKDVQWMARIVVAMLVFGLSYVAIAQYRSHSTVQAASVVSPPQRSSIVEAVPPEPQQRGNNTGIGVVVPINPAEPESATSPTIIYDIIGKTVPQVFKLMDKFKLYSSTIQPGEYGTQEYKYGDKCRITVYYSKRGGKLVCGKFQMSPDGEASIPLRDVLPADFNAANAKFVTSPLPEGRPLFMIRAKLGDKSDPHYWLVTARTSSDNLTIQNGEFDESGRREQSATLRNWKDATVTEVYGAIGGPDINRAMFENDYRDSGSVIITIR